MEVYGINSKIKKNVLLKNCTTFKIGGPAKYFLEAKTKEDLIQAVTWAKEKGTAFFVLGGGSNVLASDNGYAGLVVKLRLASCQVRTTKIVAEAGVKLDELVKLSAKSGLTGIEWAAGIPKATVGGAIYNNAGAFESCMADIVETVEVFDAADSKIKKLNKEKCNFTYKQTIFKQQENLIVLSCCLKLRKGNCKKIREKIARVLDYREKNHPMDLPSAGCIFINPFNISAAELIERAGLKGQKMGDAQISQKHANFIVNLGKARAADVLRLIDLIKKTVKQKFGIALKEEIRYLSCQPPTTLSGVRKTNTKLCLKDKAPKPF